MTRLRDRVAVVTGASSGIGRAAAVALAREGAKVALLGRDASRVEEAAAKVRAQGSVALPLLADVRDEPAVAAAASRVLEAFGRIDVLVASAGRGGSSGPRAVVQMPVEEWDAIVDTNLKGLFLSNRAVLPAMIRQRSGTIVNVSSARGGTRGTPYASAYAASKHGVMGLTAALAEEMRPYGVRVMTVLPDATDTPLIARAHATAPEGKMTAEVVAEMIVEMIASDDEAVWSAPLVAPFGRRALP
jgi:NAD(P)-dependent dehydrogenase (short-subunit alcohol dehydrogenase family)